MSLITNIHELVNACSQFVSSVMPSLRSRMLMRKNYTRPRSYRTQVTQGWEGGECQVKNQKNIKTLQERADCYRTSVKKIQMATLLFCPLPTRWILSRL